MSIETTKRRESIIKLLYDIGSVKVEALSKYFGVSSVTIRSDLRYLEKEGCVSRAHGGAKINNRFAFDRPLRLKGRLEKEIKIRIGARAAEFIQDGDSLIIDSGSTTAEIVPHLTQYRSLVVMTNALNIAYQLTEYDDIEVIVLGGVIRRNSYSLYGSTAEQQLSQYRFNTVFLGVDGFDLEAGITTPHAGEAHLNRIMCDAAHQIIAVTDGSKFGRRSFCLIRESHQIHRLITDRRIPEHYRSTLTEQGVDVIVVDE
ncbi:transcriptional repressor AgaR [Xenorhabdus littoralis]|uniref:transcriptional repressor AgaR n=1 Tax=Xenorhabdus littoralis TaxID=2582835 RepID=UPI0029E8000B|nr:transcriptional repressor AgaR [Xenorhabdus sp. psl]MDX7992851.1 DeoR/GlpR transcriptional regulator [Xenorhabdus sp. psl]